MISTLNKESLAFRLIITAILLCLPTSIIAQPRQLTTTPYNKCHLRWGPDAQRLSFSGNGKLGYVQIKDGGIIYLPITLRGDFYNSWSPDGKSIAFCASSAKGGYYIWTMPIKGGEPKQITAHTSFMPDWSPDGSNIVYVTNKSGNMDIGKVDLESLETIQLTKNTASDWHPYCSPDGEYIAFTSDRSGNGDIWMIPSAGGECVQLTEAKTDEDFVCWSPDGRKIAYVSEQASRHILCVKDLMTKKVTNLHESDSALGYLSWSPDGNMIAYTDGITGFKQIYVIDTKTALGNKISTGAAYLGQKPPGNTPVLFAPGTISRPDKIEFAITFTPDGEELFFTRRDRGTIDNRILHMELLNGAWSEPKPAPFAVDCFEFEPHVTPDGKRLFFGSQRPAPGTNDCQDKTVIWCSRSNDEGWLRPEYWGPPFDDAMFLSVSVDGTIYNSGLSKSEPVNGKFGPWEDLAFHLLGYMHPCIAPDESFVLCDTEHGIDSQSNGLFISFRQPDGSWGPVKPLKAAFDIGARCWGASLSPGGEYLFFCSEGDIYWVNSNVIDLVKDVEYFDLPYYLARVVDEFGAERGVRLYDSLVSDRYGGLPAHERSLNRLGYWFLNHGRLDLSRDILRVNTIRHPESYNAWDSYAELLLAIGDTAQAIINYRRSLDLNPENYNATKAIEDIIGHGK